MQRLERLCLRPGELSEMLGIPRSTIYKYIHDGEIKHIRLGKSYIILKKDLDDLLKRSGS